MYSRTPISSNALLGTSVTAKSASSLSPRVVVDFHFLFLIFTAHFLQLQLLLWSQRKSGRGKVSRQAHLSDRHSHWPIQSSDIQSSRTEHSQTREVNWVARHLFYILLYTFCWPAVHPRPVGWVWKLPRFYITSLLKDEDESYKSVCTIKKITNAFYSSCLSQLTPRQTPIKCLSSKCFGVKSQMLTGEWQLAIINCPTRRINSLVSKTSRVIWASTINTLFQLQLLLT